MEKIIEVIIKWLQVVNKRATKYLTFLFFEKNREAKLEFVGLSKLYNKERTFHPIKGFIGFIRLWGHDIPVVDLKLSCNNRRIGIKETSCIIIFEHSKGRKYHFGMIVDDITNIINLAEVTEDQMMPILLSAKRHLLNNSGTSCTSSQSQGIPFTNLN